MLCHCERTLRHLSRTAFVAVQVSNPQIRGDCFPKARNDMNLLPWRDDERVTIFCGMTEIRQTPGCRNCLQ
jgi:hypothetical protein